MSSPVPPEKRLEARRLRLTENLSTPRIARSLGISNASVYAILRDLGPWDGWTPQRSEYTAAEVTALRRLYPGAIRAEILAALPRREWENVCKKASALGLRRILKRSYPAGIPPIFQRLRETRELAQLSRLQLGRLIDCNPQQLTGWELGLQQPHYRSLVRWATALGFDVVLVPKDRDANTT